MQHVRHGHAALRIRIAHAHPNAGRRRDDLIADVALLAHRVAHQAQHTNDVHIDRSLLHHVLHEAGHRRGAALVARHARHYAAGLDVRAARVVRDALADEQQRLARRLLGHILEEHNAPGVPLHRCGRPIDGRKQRILALQLFDVGDDIDVELRLRTEMVDHMDGHIRRRHALRITAADVARQEASPVHALRLLKDVGEKGLAAGVHTERPQLLYLVGHGFAIVNGLVACKEANKQNREMLTRKCSQQARRIFTVYN